MKKLILYDSVYGNTEQVADAIASGMGEDVVVKKVAEAQVDDIREAELILIGCPVHGWNVSKATNDFLKHLRGERFNGKKSSAFDTKFKSLLAGGAAKKIIRRLCAIGIDPLEEPRSFFVTGMQGPLGDGELDRAREFGQDIIARSTAPETSKENAS